MQKVTNIHLRNIDFAYIFAFQFLKPVRKVTFTFRTIIPVMNYKLTAVIKFYGRNKRLLHLSI